MYVEQFRKKCAEREDEREKRNKSSCSERLTPREPGERCLGILRAILATFLEI